MTPSYLTWKTRWIIMFTKIGHILYSQQNKTPAHLYFVSLYSFAFQDELCCGRVEFEGPGNIQVVMCGRHWKASRRVLWARELAV